MGTPSEYPLPMAEAGHATADELLAHAGWIRTLAQSLCRDTWMADDLVQETWLAALRRPPKNDRPLKPWLARVLRNFAYERRRQAARRNQHEFVNEPTGTLVGEVEIEESETRAQLVEAVLELREPYRSVVMLRYWGQLEPQDIAKRQGIPSATVRTRLRRGLGELRERLEREAGGDAQAAFTAVAIVARIDPSAPFASVAAAAAPVTMTSLATRLVVGLGALFVGVVGLVFATDALAADGAPAIAEMEPALVDTTTLTAAPLLDQGNLRAPTDRAPDAPLGRNASKRPAQAATLADEEEPSGPDLIAGRVIEGGQPVAGLEVYLASGRRLRFGFEPGLLPADLTTTLTDSNGHFAFRGIEPGPYVVAVERDGSFRHSRVELTGEPVPSRTFEFGDSTIHGTVWNELGRPVDRAIVRIARPGRDHDATGFQIWLETAADGTFTQPGLPTGDWLISAKVDIEVGDDWRYDLTRSVTLAAQTKLQVDFGTGALQPEWTGSVRARTGDSIGKGHLKLRHKETGCELGVTTERDGSFAFRLPAGEYENVRWVPPGHSERDALRFAGLEVPAAGLARDLVVLGARLTGQIVDRTSSNRFPTVYLRPAISKSRRPLRMVRPAEDGSYVVNGLPPGRWAIWTSSGHLAAAGDGEEIVVTIEKDTLEVQQDLMVLR